ncbi:uncharacterized protein JCM6883_007386 [Sporobolomyces salmoneus]|uniref:uncharacterized protein n=1 Tax=Sporobolomyces salmoneus TaxID=183962 RepID=UPI00316F416A
MPPKRAPTGSSKRPSKRIRSSLPQIGALTAADDTARLVASYHLAEHAGQGVSYLSVRREKNKVESLKELSLQSAARAIYEVVRFKGQRDTGGAKSSAVGWDPNRDPSNQVEILAIQQTVRELPEDTADRLLANVLYLSYTALQSPNDPGVSVIACASIFFHDRISRLSLSSLSAPSILLNRIPQCTALVDLDLSHSQTLSDSVLAKVLVRIPSLEKINLKACTKVGDNSIKALANGSGASLRIANLSFTAVAHKGLGALIGNCPRLEVLKLQAVGNLNEKNINLIVETATNASTAKMQIPLSNLRTLKLKNTAVTDAALGRLLALCSPTLSRLDVSYTQLKSLDIISSALHTLPTWNLEKLVASGLPLTPASLESFFRPLSERPDDERNRFKVMKLGSIPATSTKAPGLTDAVLKKLLPYWETFGGLEKVSLYGNIYLGKTSEPMYSFLAKIGSRCKDLNLTNIPLDSHHLEGLLEPVTFDEDGNDHVVPSRLETLVLDSTRIDDRAMIPLGICKKLRALHVAETRISPAFLDSLLKSCPDLSVLNLTSCRGIPVTQRRNFFDSYEKGQVEI